MHTPLDSLVFRAATVDSQHCLSAPGVGSDNPVFEGDTENQVFEAEKT